jgi:alpha-tubulin suppressor-like RCC1 family protein
LVLNPDTINQKGAFILPKLGASSPGSFTASFDYLVGTASTPGDGASFNYGILQGTNGSATNMATTGLAVGFIDSATLPRIDVRWNNVVIGSAPITYASTATPVEIKLDGANFLTVSYGGVVKLRMNLAGKVNAADRTNYQFAFGAATSAATTTRHDIDNLSITSNGALPTGLALDSATGIISGTATAANNPGTQVFNLVATNAEGATRQAFTLGLASGAPVFTSAATNPMLPGIAGPFTVAAPGTAGATTYGVGRTIINTTLADATTLPAGAYINGSTRFNASALELTQNSASQTGLVQFLGEGAQNTTSFSASFDYKVGGGTTMGGTGMNFTYGAPGDNTKGLRVAFTEINTIAPLTNTNLKVELFSSGIAQGNQLIANPYLGNYNFLPIRLTMSDEGRLQVYVNDVLAWNVKNLTDYQTADKSLWAFGFQGTTSATNNNFHTIKNLVIGTNGVLTPGLTLDTTTGVISGALPVDTAVDSYVPITATNSAGTSVQSLKLDVSVSNLLAGQRPGASVGGTAALGVSGQEFRNLTAFAALKADGSVSVWGNTANGGKQADAPTGTGYTAITSNEKAFAALKNDGSIFAWGLAANGATGEPTGTGYQQIASTRDAFAALKNDGSITVWGSSSGGGQQTQAPTGTGFVRLYANGGGFTAQRSNGTVTAWGNNNSYGNVTPPVDPSTTVLTRIVSNDFFAGSTTTGAFAGLTSDFKIKTWGSSLTGGSGTASATVSVAPTSSGWVDIVSTGKAFAAIDTSGSIASWGDFLSGGTNFPKDSGYRQIYANGSAFVAVRQDGSLSAWGAVASGGSGAPIVNGYVQVFATLNAFAALKADGSITVWGDATGGGSGGPTGTGYTRIFSTRGAFAALKNDGSVSVWGNTAEGGASGPSGTGWAELTSNATAFTARKSDGTLFSWGATASGGTGAPTGSFLTVQSPTLEAPYFPLAAGAPTNFIANQLEVTQIFPGIRGVGLSFTISSGSLPPGLTLDSLSGWITGTPALQGTHSFTVTGTGRAGTVSQAFTLTVVSATLANQRQGAGATYTIGTGQQFPNDDAMAALGPDGTITAWGNALKGGSGAPTGTGYTQITSNQRAYAALKWDGSITAWGDSTYGGTGAPTGTGYKAIYATRSAFAALKSDGSIAVWGNSASGGSNGPTTGVFTKIFASMDSFAAMKVDGSITVWGDATNLGTGTPTATGFTKIVPNKNAYAALSANGTITAWGNAAGGGTGAPTGVGYLNIFASEGAYAALNVNGSIAVWGSTTAGGNNGPAGTNFVDVWSSAKGFTAMSSDGSLVSWGAAVIGTAPTGTGFTDVFSTSSAFAALKDDGSIRAWGDAASGGTGAPTGTGYTQVFSNAGAFAALQADGSISTWGASFNGGTGAPVGTGYTRIFSRANNFTAMKADGTVVSWGANATGAPVLAFTTLQSATAVLPYHEYGITGFLPNLTQFVATTTVYAGLNGVAGLQVGAFGVGIGTALTSGTLPPGITLNVATGRLEGTATTVGAYTFTITSYNESGESSQAFKVIVASNTATAAPSWLATASIGYPNYSIGQAVSYSLAGNVSPSMYQVVTGALPPGLALNATTGAVGGTPTVPGIYKFTLAASNKLGVAAQVFTILVNDGTLPNERIGQGSSWAAQTTGRQGLNEAAFAALQPGGTIITWGDSSCGGAGAAGVPTENGYVTIAQTRRAFAALRQDGSIRSWGDAAYGGSGAPTGAEYVRVFATESAFGAMKADGSITTWGDASSGGTGAPTGTMYTQIFSGRKAMTAMMAGGSIVSWGDASSGGTGAPTTMGYNTITANGSAFAALKNDGSIVAWGNTTNGGGTSAPTNNGYIAVYSNPNGFAALRGDGTITTWGATFTGDRAFPGGNNFVSISSNSGAYAALNTSGSIVAWGATTKGSANFPTGTGYTAIYSNQNAFAALKADGAIVAWGTAAAGATGAPVGTGFKRIFSNGEAFVALKSDGSLKSWGNPNYGGLGKAPLGTGFTQVFSTARAFAAQRADGSIITWGAAASGGVGAPTGTGLAVASATAMIPYYENGVTGKLPTAYVDTRLGSRGGAGVNAYQVGALSPGTWSRVSAGTLPVGLALNAATGFLSGTPTTAGTSTFTVTSSGSQGTLNQVFTLEVIARLDGQLGSQRTGSLQNAGGTFQNNAAFVAMKPDGSLNAWGDGTSGGSGAPTGTGFTQVVSSGSAFAALKSDGSVTVWGSAATGGTGAPTGTGFTQLFSNGKAFAALDALGGITAWGDSSAGGTGAPTSVGFTKIFSNPGAFAAMKADGSITAWGDASVGGTGAPAGTGFTKLASTNGAFAALNGNGKVIAWGDASKGGAGAPLSHVSYVALFSTYSAFAALKSDGSITAWGDPTNGGSGAPTATGYTQVFSTGYAFAALAANGAITAWGNLTNGGTGAPSTFPFSQVSATASAFAALKSNGSISAWGDSLSGGTGAPSTTVTGFVKVFSTSSAFAALKTDGSIIAWGDAANGGSGAPADTGYTQVFSNNAAFAALKADGSIITWGSALSGGSGAPPGMGFATVQSSTVSAPAFSGFSLNGQLAANRGSPFFANLGAQGVGVTYGITLGALPVGLTLDTATGVLSGTATQEGSYPFTLSASNSNGATQQNFTIGVAQTGASVSVWPTATAITYGQTLASSTLSGGVASVDGSFAFTTPGTVPVAGTASQGVTFTPTDTVNYAALSGTTSVLVNQATPTVTTLPTATAITYGQTLASSTLSGGVASVDGSFAFTTPGTAPNAGTASQAVVFTPTDAANYTTAGGTTSVLVNRAAVTVTTLPTATAISYGQTLASSTLSGGVASVDGSFAFTTPTTAPDAGTASQAVTFTPTDAVNYAAVSGTASVLVNQGTVTVTILPTATAITYGQTLASSTLSGGVASVGGSFAFTAPGTAPNAGTASQSVTFTPTDAANYASTSGTTSVLVNRAAPTVVTFPTATAITYGQTLASSTLSGGVAAVSGSFAFTTPTTAPDAGTASQPVIFTPTDLANYITASGTASVLVNQATVTVTTFPTATAITYGQTLASSTLSGGSASVAGSFAFTAPTTAPDAGTASQPVTFTPTDAVNYAAASGTASVLVNQATVTVTTLPTATAITYGQTLASSTLSGGVASVGGSFAFTAPTTAPDAGTASQAVTFTPTDAVNYAAASGTASVLVNQATVTVTTFPTATAITYGQTLASSTLSGGVASVGGSFAFTAPTTAPDAGTASQAVTFTPTDAVNYAAASGTASVLVNQATATVVLGGLTAVDDGTAKAASATTVPAGLTVGLTYDLSATAPSLPGTYAVVATVSDPNYVGSASGSLVISPKGPVFSGYSASTKQNQAIRIGRAKILSRASDPYGGKVALTRVFGPSAQGGAVSLVDTNVTYTPATAFVGVDTFEVELTNPAGGITRGVVTITVTGTAQPTQNLGQLTLRDGVVDLVFQGIPGRTYVIQRSANLTTWTALSSVTAAADGKINYTDANPLPSSGFYRTQE